MNSASKSYQGFSPQPPFLSRGNRNRLSCSASYFRHWFGKSIWQGARLAFLIIKSAVIRSVSPGLVVEPIVSWRKMSNIENFIQKGRDCITVLHHSVIFKLYYNQLQEIESKSTIEIIDNIFLSFNVLSIDYDCWIPMLCAPWNVNADIQI